MGDIQARSQAAVPFAWVFYGTYIVVAVFVVINLFIAVVINNLEAAKGDLTDTDVDTDDARLLREIAELRDRLGHFERLVRAAPRALDAITTRRAG